jgi:hypothetical protein
MSFRTSGVLLLLVFVCATAFAQSQPSQPAPEFKLPQDQPRHFTIVPDWSAPSAARKLGLAARLVRPSDVCYTMRSYVFAREGQGDATRLVSQRTCTYASKFRVKQAPEKPKR